MVLTAEFSVGGQVQNLEPNGKERGLVWKGIGRLRFSPLLGVMLRTSICAFLLLHLLLLLSGDVELNPGPPKKAGKEMPSYYLP